MTLFVEGSYESFKQVIRAVDTLVMRGHEKSDMKVAGTSSALQQVDESSGLSTFDYNSSDSARESSILKDYDDDLSQGKLVLLVDEAADQDKELSEDTHPTNADRANKKSAEGPSTSTDTSEDAELIDDLKSSETNLSGNRNSDDVGLSSDLNTSTDDTAGNSGLNRSI